jgi:hypothetical protein
MKHLQQGIPAKGLMIAGRWLLISSITAPAGIHKTYFKLQKSSVKPLM